MRAFQDQFIIFLRYSAAGLTSLGFELLLLSALLRLLEAPYYISVSIAFVVATIFQYEACHWWVFGSSSRSVSKEYIYFAMILLSGLVLTDGLVILFVNTFGLSVVMARLIVAVFVGLWDFYLNARFNFRVHAFLRR
ncbi:MAG: GtrA family protein [bacterium]|nr:GtrA family protein [bacterium]